MTTYNVSGDTGETIAASSGGSSSGTHALLLESAHRPLMQHAPDGPAWAHDQTDSWWYQLTKSIAYSFARVLRRAKDLLREFSPRLAVELLDEWETDWDVSTPGGTDAERQAAVVAKIQGLGPNPSSEPTLLELAEALGYEDTTIVRYTSIDAGDPAGLPLQDDGWRFRTDLVIYTLGSVVDAALLAALEPRNQAHGIIGVLDAWHTWSPVEAPISNAANGFPVYTPLSDTPAGIVVVGTSTRAAYTRDGATWVLITSAAGYAGNWKGGYQRRSDGLIVLFGDNDEIQHKNLADATFTRHTVTGTHRAIADSGSLLVIVGDAGRIYTSTDGATWTLRTAGSGYAGDFKDVVWNSARSLFIAVGTGGEVQKSSNGTAWTRVVTGSAAYTRATVLDSGRVIIVATPAYYVIETNDMRTGAYEVSGMTTTMTDIIMSPDGLCLIAGASAAPGIAISRDDGVTWIQKGASETGITHLISGPPENPMVLAYTASPDYYRGRYAGIENALS